MMYGGELCKGRKLQAAAAKIWSVCPSASALLARALSSLDQRSTTQTVTTTTESQDAEAKSERGMHG